MGRRRSFDVDEALGRALEVFWRKGYDGASLTDLTAAMRISPPSLYAAFGDKQGLFRRVLERYGDEPGMAAEAALGAESTLLGIDRLLRLAVARTTNPATPPGCLTVHGALAPGADDPGARDVLAALRRRMLDAVRRRVQRGLDEGELAPGTDPDAVARFVAVVSDGLAVAAVGGATAAELDAAVDVALRGAPLLSPAPH